MPTTLLLTALLVGCGPKEAPEVAAEPAPAAFDRSQRPAPLTPRPFEIPPVESGSLANGVSVEVVQNHEVPMVWVRVELAAGSWTDPADRPGLASVAMDMLNEGAGDLDAAQLSSAERRLAASLSTSSGLDGASVELKALKRNLEPSLAHLALVLTQPTFPQAEWEIVQKRRLADLETSLSTPTKMATRVYDNLLYGDWYSGLKRSADSYEAMDPDQLKSWWDTHGVPAQARIYVGGDTTLAEIVPLLDAALADWTGGEPLGTALPTADQLPELNPSVLYLVDKPGAAQSVIRMGRFSIDRKDPRYPAFRLANQVMGGYFSSRINMNLREDKGWTYGARTGVYSSYLPSEWTASTSVVTEHTAASVAELIAEVDGAREAAPLTQDELDAARGYLLGTWPKRFEQPNFLLGQRRDVHRYGLPDDWIASYPDKLRTVSVEQAQTAWNDLLSSDELVIVVVGDKAVVGEELADLGRPVVELDVHAEAVAGE